MAATPAELLVGYAVLREARIGPATAELMVFGICICPPIPTPTPSIPVGIGAAGSQAAPATPGLHSPYVDPISGDLVVFAGQLLMAYGTDYIRQLIRSRLLMFQGEYLPDSQEGMPWFQSILIKGYNPNAVRGAFRDRILGTNGVQSIQSLVLSFNSAQRTLSVSFAVQTNLGLLTDNFLLPTVGLPQAVS